MSRPWQIWNDWWFAPVDARSLGGMRISLGLLLLWWWAWLWPELGLLFQDDGLMDPQVIERHWHRYGWNPLIGWTLPQLQTGHLLGCAVLVAYTLGIATPLMKVLVPLMMVAVYHRSPWVWNGGDRLVRIWVLILVLTPCGAAWSVDAWLKTRWGGVPRKTVPMLGHRLIQIQLVVMYTYTGLAKLADPAWQNGSAIYWSVSDGNFNRATWLLDPILQSPVGVIASVVLVVATLVFEVGFGPLAWWKRTRAATLWAGVALHIGIFVTMSVGVFGPASVWGYQAFLSWKRAGAESS